MKSFFASYVIDIDDVRMLESCCGLCLRAELRHEIAVLGELLLKYLDRDKASKDMILCLVNVRHSAGAYFTDDLISIC